MVSALLFLATQPQAPLQIHVSTLGSDAYDGSQRIPGQSGGPKKTLKGARDEARKRRQAGASGTIEIVVLPGRYEILDPLVLGASDGSTTYRAEGEVLLTGAVRLGGAQSSDSRLPSSSRGQVMEYDLSPYQSRLGAKGHRTWNERIEQEPLSAFVLNNGQLETEARWPNQGWVRVDRLAPENRLEHPSFYSNLSGLQTPSTYSGLWLVGGLHHEKWMMYHEPVAKFDPRSGKIDITLPQPHHQDGGRQADMVPGEEGRFFLTNSPYEIDQAGEYFIDRPAGKLLYWPRQQEAEVAVNTGSLIEMQNASNIQLQGFTIQGAQRDGIRVENSSNIQLADLDISACGYWGVRVMGGSRVKVDSSHLHGTGEGGVYMDGGSRQSLTPSSHVVENCVIEDYAKHMWFYRPGVRLLGVGNTVRSTTIRNAPHAAIIFDGNDNVIEKCLIERVCLESNDASAIYGWYDFACWGTKISQNWIRDTRNPIPVRFEVFGIYLDGSRSGVSIDRCLLTGLDSAVNLGSGFGNSLTNSVIANAKFGVSTDLYTEPASSLDEAKQQLPITSGTYRNRYPVLSALLNASSYDQVRQHEVAGNTIINVTTPLQGPNINNARSVRNENNRTVNMSSSQLQSLLGGSTVDGISLRSILGIDPSQIGARR